MLTEKNKKFTYNICSSTYQKPKRSSYLNKENIADNPNEFELQRIQSQNKRLESELLNKNTLLEEQDRKMIELKTRYQQVIQKMKQEFMSLQNNMQKIQKMIADKDNQILRLKNSNRQFQQKIEKQQNQKSLILSALKDKNDCIISLTSEIDKISQVYKEKFDAAEENQRTLQENNHLLQNQIDQLKSQKIILTEKNTKLNTQITQSSLMQINYPLNQELQVLKSKHSELEDQNSILKHQTYSNESELRLLKQQYQAYKMLKQIEIMELKNKLSNQLYYPQNQENMKLPVIREDQQQ